MNNVFHKRKDRMARYPQTPVAVNYTAGSWVDAFTSGALEFNGELISFGISVTDGSTDTPDNPVHRIMHIPKGHSTGTVLYPFESSTGEASKASGCYTIYPVLKVNQGDTLIVQVNCSSDAAGTAKATVDFIEIKEER